MSPLYPTLCSVCALAALLSGCNRAGRPEEATLRIGLGLGRSAQVGALSSLTDRLYAEPLVALDALGRPMARLAQRWNWEDNGMTLRVVLRNGTKLHDGRTLDDGMARRFLQARITALRERKHYGAFDRVSSIEIPDSRTLLLRLTEPDAFLIPELNNADIVDPQAPDVGTGPFRLISRTPVTAQRFEHHHRGAPAIGQVRIATYDSRRAAWAALMRGEVDAAHEVNPDSVEFLERTPGLQTFGSLRPYYWALSFNVRHPQLESADVRRALSLAVNREEVVASVLRGYGAVASDPVWPLFWAYPNTSDAHPYDPAAARELLNRAGVAKAGSAKLRFRCLFYGEDPQFERMALLVQRQLSEVGVELELQPVSMNQMLSKMGAGEFDSFLMMFHSGRALDWTYRFWRSPRASEQALQATGYIGADDVLDQLRGSYADPEVREGVLELRKRFYDDPPAVFIAWQRAIRAVSTRFDVSDVGEQDVFANIWQWKPVPDRK